MHSIELGKMLDVRLNLHVVLSQYEDELSRVKMLRQEKLASFIDAVRTEITGLWQSLHYGPKTCRYFEAFYEGGTRRLR